MANGVSGVSSDASKTKYGFYMIVIGFAFVFAALVFSVLHYSDVKDATAAVGSISGVIGTLAGAFFGVHAGAAGKDKAEAERQQAQQKVERLAAMLSPNDAVRALQMQ